MSSGSEEEYHRKKKRVTKKRRRKHLVQSVFDRLVVSCEWQGCGAALPKDGGQFYTHVALHLLGHDLIKVNVEDDSEYYKCSWSACEFISIDRYEITRHVKYHGYLAELRAKGAYVAKFLKLPPCLIQDQYYLYNFSDSPLICEWDGCGENCLGFLEFIYHVHWHTDDLPPAARYVCKWEDCTWTFDTKGHLNNHLRKHTKQQHLACAQCGRAFSMKVLLENHCATQIPIEEHNYQCDFCLTYHPTERLLKKHAAQHINHFKCSFCNMTCNKPSVLAKHIRYRHLSDRPFKCSFCEKTFKVKQDLEYHILSHIRGEYVCSEDDCDYITKSQLAMKMHVDANHGRDDEGLYCCHICDKKFFRGSALTNHLAKLHNLKKPPGYSRFQYRLENDGFRRLQCVRLESLEAHSVIDAEQVNIVDGIQVISTMEADPSPTKINLSSPTTQIEVKVEVPPFRAKLRGYSSTASRYP